jgi:hypothetical protein
MALDAGKKNLVTSVVSFSDSDWLCLPLLVAVTSKEGSFWNSNRIMA